MSNLENIADKHSEILNELEYLGLTHYEAELFLTLSHKEMTARELSQANEIPYTKVYGVLEKMIQLNLVQKIEGNPTMFSIPEPATVISILCEENRSKIDKIEDNINDYLSIIRNNADKSKDLKVSWSIVGLSKVQYYLQTMIKNSRHSIYVMDPGIRTIDNKLCELLKAKKDVQLKIIVSACDIKKMPRDLLPFSRIYDRLNSRYYIFDGGTSFMISIEKDHDIYGIVEPCSNCVLQSREHFEMIWDRSKPACPKGDDL